jgi:hypothetical protein
MQALRFIQPSYMITSTLCGIIYILHFMLLDAVQDTKIHYSSLV